MILTTHSVASAPEHLDIPAGDLPAALDLLTQQSHAEFIYSAQDLRGLHTNGVHGDLTAEAAVRELLKGTDLVVTVHPSGAILIARHRAVANSLVRPGSRAPIAPAPTKPQEPEEVVVMGTATALVATRTETPLREIPQSVSLISSEQIRQQNDTDLTDALSHTPGITVVRNDSVDESYYSRGFLVTSFHVDGGAALFNVSGIQQLDSLASISTPLLGPTDLSEFDHIEVLRGADALFTSNGNPGATVSMVRKHPLATPQIAMNAWAGSWSNTHVEADATGPLALDGALRGRLDVVYTNRNYFYDTSHFERKRFFAVFDYDLSPSTLLTLGGSYQWDDAVPNTSGLPRNIDGSDPHLPRSTALTFDWAEYRLRTGELYLQLRQQLGSSWRLTANASTWIGSLRYAYGAFVAPVDPLTGGLHGTAAFFISPRSNPQRQFTTDITLTGTGNWFGHRQEFAIGADFTRTATRLIADTYQPADPVVPDAYAYDPGFYPDPRTSLTPAVRQDLVAVERRAGLFSSLRLFLRDDFSVIGGARFSGNRINSTATSSVAATHVSFSSSYGNSSIITPYAGALYDIDDHFSLYASYADIYRTAGRDNEQRELKPSHGVDIEGGLKFGSRSGSLNGALMVYRIKQNDIPINDPSNPPLGLLLADNVSKGIEAEIGGRLQPGWEISAGYTFNINREADGAPLSAATPRHLVKLWTAKQLPGILHRWTIGGELQAQSANSRSGLYCPVQSGFCDTLTAFKAEQRSYAIMGLRTGFQIDSHWSASLSVSNILDRTYYEAISRPPSENWYGDPRSFLLRVDGRY